MNVDAMYVISLGSCQFRRQKMLKWLPKDVHWYVAKKHQDGGSKGCYESHKAVIEDAKQRGYSKVLIFEDDAKPEKEWDEIVKEVNRGLKEVPEDFVIFSVGSELYKAKQKISRHIYKSKRSTCLTAYIINVDKISIEDYNLIPIDVYLLCPSKYKTYVYSPPLFSQTLAKTQINEFYQSIKSTHFHLLKNEAFSECSLYIDHFAILGIFIIILILLFSFPFVPQKHCGVYYGICLVITLAIVLYLILDNVVD